VRDTPARLVRHWPVWIAAAFVAVGVFLPIAYLVLCAAGADMATLGSVVFRTRNLHLLANTLSLAAGVLLVATLIALPLAWLTTRSDVPGRRLVTLLGVLPLAIPGYVMAYVLLAVSGRYGALSLALGVDIPRPGGYVGALLALSLYTFPYMFLNLRAALLGLDVSIEESAQALGLTRRQVFFRIVLPQLKPAWMAGGLLIVLHVLGDFGVVSLMRFKTFSYAIFLQYTGAFDRLYAAWLALMLLAVTATLLLAEAKSLRTTFLARRGPGSALPPARTRLGPWRIPVLSGLALVALWSVVLPLGTLVYWSLRGLSSPGVSVAGALLGSVSASAPAAVLTVVLALPVAYASARLRIRSVQWLERVAWMGYAIPPLALALAVIFMALSLAPGLYQTMFLLVAVYAVHFLAEALGPLRTAFYQANPSVEESARTLGRSRIAAFLASVLPSIRPGLVTATAFIFLSVMKELPLTYLLSPIGFQSLAVNVWSLTNEAQYALAAPHALMIVAVSSLFVGLLLHRESNRNSDSNPDVPA